jgi:4a-hydroxytetrahydrobiopterin dehydratase
MAVATAEKLAKQKCVPCEGGVPPVPAGEVKRLLAELPNWHLAGGGKTIRREWRAKDFVAAIDFFKRIAKVAEAEDHHPDLHLTGYRNVAIELSTHAIGGLSMNDFILAAKIDQLPIKLKE